MLFYLINLIHVTICYSPDFFSNISKVANNTSFSNCFGNKNFNPNFFTNYPIYSCVQRKYKTTTIARDVSDATVAYMNEHSDTLTGVSIEEDTIRKYNDAEYFASIIGYTGKISTDEYNKLSEKDETYTTNDIIGKAGLEQYYESYLRGVNGEKENYEKYQLFYCTGGK